VAEKATAEILSLPLYPELTDEQAQAVAAAVEGAAREV
jgi:dTDP-4-amino-4,6-dideoxygalactose transaminase